MATTRTGAVMDAPDPQVREAYRLFSSGQPITRAQQLRLKNRVDVENENRRTGGNQLGALPRATSIADAAAQGAASVAGGNPNGSLAPRTPVARAPQSGVTGTAPGHGGIDVRSYAGSRYGGDTALVPGYQPHETNEQAADNVLNGRAGIAYGSPAAPNITPRGNALNPGESAVIAGRAYQGNPTPAAAAAPAARAAAPSPAITPPAREANNPLTGDAASVPPGQTQDLSAKPSMFYGGMGDHRQGFQTQESADIYDGFVKRLFDTHSPQEAASASPVQAAPPPVSPVAPANQETDWSSKATGDVLSGALGQKAGGGIPRLGAMKEIGRRIFDSVVPSTDGMGNPLRRMSARGQAEQNARVGSPQRSNDLAAAGTP